MIISGKKRIGIFGGSFDPPHRGHLEITKLAIKKLFLDQVYWCLTEKNPFKNKAFFSLKERMEKSTKSLKKFKDMNVLYLDDKIKSSRMINIINYFRVTRNQKNLYLILGSDNLLNFHKWASWKNIVKLTKLVVFSRKGYDKQGKESLVVKYINKKNIIFINNKLINVSSSNIKKKIK